MLKQIKTSAVNYVSVAYGVAECFDVSFNPLTGNLENRFLNKCTPISYHLCPTHAFNLRSAYHAILIDGNRGYLEFNAGTENDNSTWVRVISQLLDTRITNVLSSTEIAEIILNFVNELSELTAECLFCYNISSLEYDCIIVSINDEAFINFLIPTECCSDFKQFLSDVFDKMIYAKITFKEYTEFA